MEFKIGDRAWTEYWDTISEVEVIKIYSNSYKVHAIEHYGTFGVKKEKMFKTKEEVIIDYKKRIQERKNEIAKNINSVEDLIVMMYSRMTCNEEYNDYEAIEVANEKAEKLLGIKLSELVQK